MREQRIRFSFIFLNYTIQNQKSLKVVASELKLMILTSKMVLFSSLFYIVMSSHLDFRERFLERKRLRALNAQRVTVLNKMENTVILDDITHYRKLKGRLLKKIRAVEKDFRRLLAMDGMKYNYKRDLFWRTWRSIPPVYGATKEIVCYKCNNLIHGNSTANQSCGTWSIEDSTPPCPFEFYSLVSDESFCGANITQYKDVKHNCPSIIKFSDLTATCDNPIETQWRFTKKFGVTEERDNIICKEDFCEIFTSYEITPEQVVFRIINATNDVIYSRIMKPKNKNYICLEDCGHFNPETRKVTKANGKPLKLNLLARKMKRNDHLLEIVTKKELLKEINENITKREDLLNEINENFTKRNILNEMNKIVTKREDLVNGKNENLTKRKEHWNKFVKKRQKLKEMKDYESKRAVLNKTNDSNMYTDELLDERSASDVNEDVLNVSTHLSAAKREKIMNELLPMEEDMSTLNWGGNAFDLVSVEVDSLHNIKSRGKEINFTIEKEKTLHRPTAAIRPKNNLASKGEKHSDSILHKPTITPRVQLKKKEDYISYEDENQGLEYS